MKRSFAVSVAVAAAVIGCTVAMAVLTHPGLEHIFSGERGRPRIELTTFAGLRVPLLIGLGIVAAITLIATSRARRDQRGGVDTILTIGAAGILALVVLHSSFAHRDESHNPQRVPRSAYDVFTSGQWRQLAAPRDDATALGPRLRHGPGLRDFPGYIPYDPCLLSRITFKNLSEEEVRRVLGPPRSTPTDPERHLQYRMIDLSPRQRIANLVLSLDTTPERGKYVVLESLLPHYATLDCPVPSP